MIEIPKNKQQQKGQNTELKLHIPIQLQTLDSINSKCEFKHKHQIQTSPLHTIQFPQINLEKHHQLFSIRGHICQHQQEQDNIKQTNKIKQYIGGIQQYDTKYLMRNFPLSYFQNVDLLFKMISKKKRFINNTYKSQKKDKSNYEDDKNETMYKQTERIEMQKKMKPTTQMRKQRKIHHSTNKINENRQQMISKEHNITRYNATMIQISNKQETNKCYELKVIPSDNKIGRPLTNKYNRNNTNQINPTTSKSQTTNNFIWTEPKEQKQKSRVGNRMNKNNLEPNQSSNIKSKSESQIGKRESTPNIKPTQNLQQKQVESQTKEIINKQINSPKIIIANQQNPFRKSETISSQIKNINTHPRGLKSQIVEMSKKGSAFKNHKLKANIQDCQNSKQIVNEQQQAIIQILKIEKHNKKKEQEQISNQSKEVCRYQSKNRKDNQKQNNNKVETSKTKQYIENDNIIKNRKQKQLKTLKKTDQIQIRTKINHQTIRNDKDEPLLAKNDVTKINSNGINRNKEFISQQPNSCNHQYQDNIKQATSLLESIKNISSAAQVNIPSLSTKPKTVSFCQNQLSTTPIEQYTNQLSTQSHQKLNLTPTFFVLNDKLQVTNNRTQNINNQTNLTTQFKPLQKYNQSEVKDCQQSFPKKQSQLQPPYEPRFLPIQQNNKHGANKQNQTYNQDSINISQIDHIYDQIVELGVNQNMEFTPIFSFNPYIETMQHRQQQKQQTTQTNNIAPTSPQIQQSPVRSQQTNNQIIIDSHKTMSKVHIPFTESAHFFNFHQTNDEKSMKEKDNSNISILNQQSSSHQLQNLNQIENNTANKIEYLNKSKNNTQNRIFKIQEQIIDIKDNQILQVEEKCRSYQALNQSTICISMQPHITKKYQRQNQNKEDHIPSIETLPKPIVLMKQPSCLILNTQQQLQIEKDLIQLDNIICHPEINHNKKQLWIQKIQSVEVKNDKEENTIIPPLSTQKQINTLKEHIQNSAVITAQIQQSPQPHKIIQECNENLYLMGHDTKQTDSNQITIVQSINKTEDEEDKQKDKQKNNNETIQQKKIVENIKDQQYNNKVDNYEQFLQREITNIQALPIPIDNQLNIISDKFQQDSHTRSMKQIQQPYQSEANICMVENNMDKNNYINHQQAKEIEGIINIVFQNNNQQNQSLNLKQTKSLTNTNKQQNQSLTLNSNNNLTNTNKPIQQQKNIDVEIMAKQPTNTEQTNNNQQLLIVPFVSTTEKQEHLEPKNNLEQLLIIQKLAQQEKLPSQQMYLPKSTQININHISSINQSDNTTKKDRNNVKMHKMYDINIINQLSYHNFNSKSTKYLSSNIQNNTIQTQFQQQQKTIIQAKSQSNQKPINQPQKQQSVCIQKQSNSTTPVLPNLNVKNDEIKTEKEQIIIQQNIIPPKDKTVQICKNVTNESIESKQKQHINIDNIPKIEQTTIVQSADTLVQQQYSEKSITDINQGQQPLIINIQSSSRVKQHQSHIRDNITKTKQNSSKQITTNLIQIDNPIKNTNFEQIKQIDENTIEKQIASSYPQLEYQTNQNNFVEKVQTTQNSKNVETSVPKNDINSFPIAPTDITILQKTNINTDQVILQQQCILKTPSTMKKEKVIVKKQIHCQCEETIIYLSDMILITEQNESCLIQPTQLQQQKQNMALKDHNQINSQANMSEAIQNNIKKLNAINDSIIEQIQIRQSKNASTETFNMKQDAAIQTTVVETSQKIVQLARISNYCINHGNTIDNLPDSLCKLNNEQWQVTMKILKIINPNNEFITRLIDKSSIWLCTPHKQKHSQQTFRRYNISSLQPSQFTEDLVLQTVKRMLGNQYLQNNIKYYLQILTGMPVLMVKQSCHHKLDNLYRHSNIFGFTYGHRRIWKITGTVKNIKKPNEKRIKLEDVKSKKIIEISWNTFLEEFKYSVISCFALNYHLRSECIPNRTKDGNSLTFGLSISNKIQENRKIQCLLGVQLYCHDEIQGKVMIYGKVEGVSQEQHFKYLGSGDLALVSMRLKPGQYLIIIEVNVQKEQITGGRLLMGCESNSAKIWLEDSWQKKKPDHTNQ